MASVYNSQKKNSVKWYTFLNFRFVWQTPLSKSSVRRYPWRNVTPSLRLVLLLSLMILRSVSLVYGREKNDVVCPLPDKFRKFLLSVFWHCLVRYKFSSFWIMGEIHFSKWYNRIILRHFPAGDNFHNNQSKNRRRRVKESGKGYYGVWHHIAESEK